MVAFEIKINGKKRCVAGLNEAGNLIASLWWTKQKGTRQKAWLTIGGVTGEPGNSDRVLSWVDDDSLRVGDRVSIRIVQATTVDPPAMISETRRRSARRRNRAAARTRA